jgi:hypothetical protein
MKQHQKEEDPRRRKNRTLEETAMLLLNMDGWELFLSDGFFKGKTPKGQGCTVKFLKLHDGDKMVDINIVKELWESKGSRILMISDTEGTFYYWLDVIKPELKTDGKKIHFPEKLSSIKQKF